MPSVILTAASGGPWPIVSGNFWSGTGAQHPIGGIQLRLDTAASGNAYVGLSGGMTVRSGGFLLSGVNTTDGMIMAPGDSYFIPKAALAISGTLNVYATVEAAGSGQARLFYEMF